MKEKLIELLNRSFDEQYYKRGLLTARHTAEDLIENGVTFATDNNVGRWIIHSSGTGANTNNWAECSECHVAGSPQWKRCPVCEAKMEVE